MQYFREFAADLWCRYGTMFPSEHKPKTGYSSLYAISKDDAAIVSASGESSGWSRFKAYSDFLLMDFDDGEATLWEALPKLLDLGAPLTVYTSGGKGYHVVIPIEPMYGLEVPYSQKAFVKSLGIACDLAIYSFGRIVSNEGRVHPKTKNKKRKILEFFGEGRLSIPIRIKVAKTIDVSSLSDKDELESGLSRVHFMMMHEPYIGNRYNSIWKAATCFAKAGVPMETCHSLIDVINSYWTNPKEEGDIEVAITSAYEVCGE